MFKISTNFILVVQFVAAGAWLWLKWFSLPNNVPNGLKEKAVKHWDVNVPPTATTVNTYEEITSVRSTSIFKKYFKKYCSFNDLTTITTTAEQPPNSSTLKTGFNVRRAHTGRSQDLVCDICGRHLWRHESRRAHEGSLSPAGVE